MKTTTIFIGKFILVLLAFLLVGMAAGAIITPVFGDLSGFDMPDTGSVLKGMLTAGIIQCAILVMIARRLRLPRWKRGLFLTTVLFSINMLMNIIESLIFMRNTFPVALQMGNLVNGLILSLVLGFLISALWSGSEGTTVRRIQWRKPMILSWIGWVVLWFIIYWTAGILIPMNVEGVYNFYFSEGGSMDLSLVPLGYAAQILRGSIWILLALGIHRYMDGSILERALITGLVFGCLMSSDLLTPNFLMPDLVRLAHLPEILFVNLLWGILISRLTARYVSVD